VVLQEGFDKQNKWRKWAALSGPLFKNECANAEHGQQKFTGLTELGDQQFKQHLADVRAAQKDKEKHKFKKDHLAWCKEQNNIERSSCEAEMARRAQANAKEGIAKDTEEEKKFDDSLLFGVSDVDDSSVRRQRRRAGLLGPF